MLPDNYGRALQSARPRALLEVLAKADGGVRYSEARKRLEVQGLVTHPQEFQRALDQLMNGGLVQGHAIPKGHRPANDARPVVMLEISLLGKVLWRYENLKQDALAQAVGEFGLTVDQLPMARTPGVGRAAEMAGKTYGEMERIMGEKGWVGTNLTAAELARDTHKERPTPPGKPAARKR